MTRDGERDSPAEVSPSDVVDEKVARGHGVRRHRRLVVAGVAVLAVVALVFATTRSDGGNRDRLTVSASGTEQTASTEPGVTATSSVSTATETTVPLTTVPLATVPATTLVPALPTYVNPAPGEATSTSPPTAPVATTTTTAPCPDIASECGPLPGPPLSNVAMAANAFSCAIAADTRVYCWGDGNYGQLGNGAGIISQTPVAVFGITGATAIATGSAHACAIVAGGDVRCWGYNNRGQLGNVDPSADPYTGGTGSSVPVFASGVHGATAIAAGIEHTCAIVGNGSVQCWGDNEFGQLGDGTTDNSFVPVTVSGITDATAIAANNDHSCALLANGRVRCWGNDGSGPLAGSPTAGAPTPGVVAGIEDAVRIDVGAYHACALLTDGHVRCWGSNPSGQLGNGTTDDSLTAVTVSGIANATAISTGYGHSCAIVAGGEVRCWGDNGWHQLGDGTTAANSLTPVAVTGLRNAVGIAGHAVHTCVLLVGGQARCWGTNMWGQLGDGTYDNSSTPVVVVGFDQ